MNFDSTIGTFLNDRPNPIAREELKDNDILRVGEVTLKIQKPLGWCPIYCGCGARADARLRTR